jgi:hypothetical protein
VTSVCFTGAAVAGAAVAGAAVAGAAVAGAGATVAGAGAAVVAGAPQAERTIVVIIKRLAKTYIWRFIFIHSPCYDWVEN